MAKYTRLEVVKVMEETGLVPLFYHPDVELGKKVLKTCYEAGARLLEFTARGDFAHEVFSELNKYALAELPGMIMGVGSVTDAAAASRFMALGANYIFSNFNRPGNREADTSSSYSSYVPQIPYSENPFSNLIAYLLNMKC